jgi:hypothetical protein
MSELQFGIMGAQAKRYAALPTISFRLHVSADEPIEALVLRAQVRIEPQWRAYDSSEKTLLGDIFGTPDRWGTTLRTFSWADVPVTVPAFECETDADVNVACTYDFDQTATRFLHALGGGEIPLRFLFSGAVFRYGATGLSTERVSWSSECAFRMPLAVWHDAMRACYGDDALIRVNRETLERLHRYRALIGAVSWDQFFERLLGAPTT